MAALGVRAAGIVTAACLYSACATASLPVPRGPWTPDPSGPVALGAATAACAGARTLSAEIAVSGRAAGTRLRGRVLAGFERPGRVRLEGLAPFGAPVFILAGRGERATLLLPRERRVLEDAAVEDVLEALTGIRRSADDLAALLNGCLISRREPGAIARNASGWLAVPLGHGVEAFLARDGVTWRVAGGRRAPSPPNEPGWIVQYRDFVAGFPSAIRLQEDGPTGTPATRGLDLTLRVSQRDVNVPIDAAAFEIAAPAGAAPLTLDDLRQAGPLADSSTRKTP